MLQRLRQQRRIEQQEQTNAVADAMRQAEQSKLVIAREFHEKRAHDLLSQAQSRMEGTMISPVDKATALERVKGVGEFGLVRQFPSPATEVPVGSGFVLAGGGAMRPLPKPAVISHDYYRTGKRMFPQPPPSPGMKYPSVMGYK